ncbi:MAG: hypothetical protein AAF267_15260 [Deinococcota bacterium]
MTQGIHHVIYWLNLHDLQLQYIHLAGILTPTWLRPSAASVLGVFVVLNAIWIVNLLSPPKPWQRRLVSTLSWLGMVTFLQVMLPLTSQLGQAIVSRSSTFGMAEATLWGMVALTTSLIWLSGLILIALLMTQTLGLSHLTHRIRHYLASFVGLQPPALAHVKVSEVA